MINNSNLKCYYDALERLKKNIPTTVPYGTKINNDTVSLEAGRKRGSIKKSRVEFTDLINKINEAKDETEKPLRTCKEALQKSKKKQNEYKEKYHRALGRELMLVEKLSRLEKTLSVLKKQPVNNT
jgi:phenylalanyl-tRNA synthetase alpha subunit